MELNSKPETWTPLRKSFTSTWTRSLMKMTSRSQLLLGYGIIVPRHAQTAADASEIGIQWLARVFL
jgi:hypothetical protein